MAAVTGAVIAAGATAYAANQQKKAAQGAANSAQRTADAATAEQARQYDQSREDMMPWMSAGQNALAQMGALNAGDFSSFQSSPDYVYARDQMQQGVERGAAARGSLYSGGTNVDLANALNGIASQNYGNFYNRLAGLAGVGQTTSNNLANLGQNYANAVGNNAWGAANARASAYQQSANANSQLAAGIGGIANNWAQGYAASRGNTNMLSGTGSQAGWGNSTNPGSIYNFGNNLSNFKGSV
jgi:hypothetical protein